MKYRICWRSTFTDLEDRGEWLEDRPTEDFAEAQADCPGFIHWIEERP